MLLAVTLVLMAPQQLEPVPFPAEVGSEVVVRTHYSGGPLHGPIPDQEVTVLTPSGRTVGCGRTDAIGELRFVPDEVGYHVFSTRVGDVEVIAPLPVIGVRRKWLAAVVLVPLGLALLWRNLRRASVLPPRVEPTEPG